MKLLTAGEVGVSESESIVGIIRSAFSGKETRAPKVTVDFGVSLDASFEDDEMEELEPELDCIGKAYGIVYTDAKGRESNRRITVKSLNNQRSDLLVKAFCHERQAARSFKASRITQVVDLETGEVFDDAADLFSKYLSNDPTYETLRTCGPGLQVLTFMARCDDDFHYLEQDIIMEYVLSKSPENIDYDAVRSHVYGLYPDSESFERGLILVSKKGESELTDILHWMRRVVDADGVISEDEFEWLIEAEPLLVN